ncbi:ABC transporter ATP-binding protein [Rugosimonospora acidiphila]|uniref:ABC transporter ATP-binding protein n=1 Tax=Rugosimonospora acidiphila TaxID=556531 RepID=A0ABP9SRY3_9ACTN
MNTVITARGVTKRYHDVSAVDSVSFSVRENGIYGLLGRNGAGKTTLMQMVTGQLVASGGELTVFGERPYENAAVLSNICFIKESQRYPDGFKVRHVLDSGRILFPRWDDQLARNLLRDFQLPLGRGVKKLSRGMRSSLGIVIGLASRAPLTLFDEPYLGLDAVARQLFYDRLLADYSEHPRTVLLSTHLIDEVSDLIEHVLLIDRGRILLDEEADTLRGQVLTVTGPSSAIDELTLGAHELYRERMGALARATVRGPLDSSERSRAESLGLDLTTTSLQQLVVSITRSDAQPKETAQ